MNISSGLTQVTFPTISLPLTGSKLINTFSLTFLIPGRSASPPKLYISHRPPSALCNRRAGALPPQGPFLLLLHSLSGSGTFFRPRCRTLWDLSSSHVLTRSLNVSPPIPCFPRVVCSSYFHLSVPSSLPFRLSLVKRFPPNSSAGSPAYPSLPSTTLNSLPDTHFQRRKGGLFSLILLAPL